MVQNIQWDIENHGFPISKTTIKMCRTEKSPAEIGPSAKENGQTACQKAPTRNQKSNIEEIWPAAIADKKFIVGVRIENEEKRSRTTYVFQIQ